MHMLTVMIVGLSMGTTVSVGQAVGAGDRKQAAHNIGNTVILFLVVSTKTGENGVYLIGTGAELAWFAQKVNGGSTKISGILTAYIDLAGYEWTPIGTASKQFAGTFDGQNHTVDNLSINYSSTTPIPLYRGLFGWGLRRQRHRPREDREHDRQRHRCRQFHQVR